MDIQSSNSLQINASIMDGNNQMGVMFANIHPRKALNINLEIMDPEYAEAHKQEIADAFDWFVHEAIEQAASCGVPVNEPGPMTHTSAD